MKQQRWAGFKVVTDTNGRKRNCFARKTPEEVLQQFHASYRVNSESGCWEWVQYTHGSRSIYGAIHINGKLVKAHRYSYEFHCGKIPEKLIVRHKCDNTICVNPDHLLVGTHKQNTQDMYERGRNKTVVKKGEDHPRSILTELLIQRAMQLKKDGESITSIAKIIGFKRTTIAAVMEGRTWRHVTHIKT